MKEQVENLDWNNLGFAYHDLPYSFEAKFKDGQWQPGKLTTKSTLEFSEAAEVLHYGQEVFEGLKAYRRKDGQLNLFRPELNGERMVNSAKRLAMEPYPVDAFVDSVKQVVKANEDFVPPYESGGSLYVRPFMVGTSSVVGVQPAVEYTYHVYATPVGAYVNGLSPAAYTVSQYDRASYAGTGQAKTSGNYASSLIASMQAHQDGFADCLFLDPREHKYVDEFGGANFFGITRKGQFVTPKSNSILPSITKRSLLTLAKKQGLNPVETKIPFADLDQFVEAGAIGTAAVISPVGSLTYQGKKQIFYSETEAGPVTTKLYNELLGIQYGDRPDPEHWTQTVESGKVLNKA
ncbi:branched-chain amino acid aminotransferase [Ligilactobacillus salitolerans]|uniref:Branched-chain-amino-acid aminotransferase n=1 Tax=Ligilactobacillus salitolerans TaxID=1808352 RepID=A0A401ISA7_9LACO|nr:branched-chain amino acid aminotransferase [Ligilactobacillus salitolerans]GBG94385.1 branched-chain amino acid aminotransferase [Ligilactobacillus salitolerans]